MTTTAAVRVPERASRQELLAPHERLREADCLVVGQGAVGRQVALQLAAMGVKSLTLFDHDTVEVVNLSPQLYSPDDVGGYKAEVTREDCHGLNPDVEFRVHARRFAKSDWRKTKGAFVFACADSMAVRKNVWEASCRGGAAWLGDCRVAGEVARVLASPGPAPGGEYEGTLYGDEEAHQGACSARMVIYGAQAAASLAVARFAQHLRGAPAEFSDVVLNLLSWELFES